MAKLRRAGYKQEDNYPASYNSKGVFEIMKAIFCVWRRGTVKHMRGFVELKAAGSSKTYPNMQGGGGMKKNK